MPEKFIFTQSDGDGATKVIEVTANDAKSAAWAFHDFCRDGYKAVSYTHLTLPTNREV